MNEWDRSDECFRDSRTHVEGADLDRVVVRGEPGAGTTALDVATGGGHVTRRLVVFEEVRFPKRHAMADWLSATGCGGGAADEVGRLLAHIAEPAGAGRTDGKWVAKACLPACGLASARIAPAVMS